MSEQFFLKWLNRSDKSFTENLHFAINAWKSSEFNLNKKFDLILNWLADCHSLTTTNYRGDVTPSPSQNDDRTYNKQRSTELCVEEGKQGNKRDSQNFPINEYAEILQLRAPSTLISSETKKKFVEAILKNINTGPDRISAELLYKLLSLEWMQDLIRSDYDLTARIYGKLFDCFEVHLRENVVSKQLQSKTNTNGELFASILKLFKEQLKNSGYIENWRKAYDEHIVQSLTQVLLTLLVNYEINFFDEIQDLESILREKQKNLVQTLLRLPMHSAMLTLECAIVNLRIDKQFLTEVCLCIFSDIEDKSRASNHLLRAAYTLEAIRKHNVLLNFEIDTKSAMSFLGQRIHKYASVYRNEHLCEVLLLLCAALRLNPLILEQHIFELTIWMIVAPKSMEDNGQTLVLFEEFLSLLLDMFRRLSRAEKFVVNLLKALKEWLSKNQLPPLSESPKKLLKRKMKHYDTFNKRIKLNDGNVAFLKFSNDIYIEMLFHDFRKQLQSTKQQVLSKKMQNSFVHLCFSWPSSTIGYSFSCLITGLVVKASITIWKTLLYALKDQLEMLNNDTDRSENAHFRLDFHASLLCQYFAGARPNEKYENYISEIGQLRMLTKEVLSTFGKFVLERSHQSRTTNAFLECCYYASTFELLLAYYKPDGLKDDSLTADSLISNLHSFLDPQQWSTLEQQITNYGKGYSLILLKRLELQRIEARKLLEEPKKKLLLDCGNESSQLEQLLNASANGSWLISQLSRKEKIMLINYKMQDISSLGSHNFLQCIGENAEALELLSYAIFEYLSKNFNTTCPASLIATLNCDFESIRQCSALDHLNFDKEIKSTVCVIAQSGLNYKLKNLPIECVTNVLELLPCLPLGCLRRQTKSLLFTFYIALYQDLKIGEADKESKQLFDYLIDLLHFGPQVPVFRYFKMAKILQLLPIAECWDFYKYLFSTIKNEEKGTDEFLISLEQLLSHSLNTKGTLSGDERSLLIIAIETLSALSGPLGRRVHKHLHTFLIIYEEYVFNHFESETLSKKDKKFVEKTLPGFAPLIKAVLGAAVSNKGNEEKNCEVDKVKEHLEKSFNPLDENFRRICKIYIGHSMDYRNPHALQLTQVALKNRKLLHLDLDEIELVLNTYWRQLNADLKQTSEIEKENSFDAKEVGTTVAKTSETLVKMIIENKTNEDFLITLKDIASNIIDERSDTNIIELFTLIAKSSFSTIKGAIFNEQFKQINGCILLRLPKPDQTNFSSEILITKLMKCQQACIENKTIPLTSDTLDAILGLLICINIKKFTITDANVNDFFTLHAAMTSLCLSIVKHRHILLMDRISQFMHIFKDLLQAVVLYKTDRQKDTSLNSNELSELTELALKLEILMHAISMHKTDVKRVAPFILLFVINLMVSGKRPTTLYPKMKTHIEAICYTLIGICDHHVGSFILRCSNEASRQTYESLVKDYGKYHKFKGKV